jgi:hypothetical protein
MATMNPPSTALPTPEKRRGRSPWVYAGVASLALLLILVICGGLLMLAFYRTFHGPLNKADQIAGLGVPVYPTAQWDEDETRLAQATAASVAPLVGNKNVVADAFHVVASPPKVLAWYDTQLTILRYRTIATRPNEVSAAQGRLTHTYLRSGELINVTVQPAPGERNATALYVIRESGASIPAGTLREVPLGQSPF